MDDSLNSYLYLAHLSVLIVVIAINEGLKLLFFLPLTKSYYTAVAHRLKEGEHRRPKPFVVFLINLSFGSS